MDVERLRELVLAHPFKAFNLVMDDGRKLPVDKPYFLGISPDGRLIGHSSLDGWFERFPPNRVTDVDFDVDLGLLKSVVRPQSVGSDNLNTEAQVTVEDIRSLRRASPFKPFNLVMADGRKLPVDQPHYLAISPRGGVVVHASTDGWFERFPPSAVASTDFEIDPAAIDAIRRLAAENLR